METTEIIVKRMIENFSVAFRADTQLLWDEDTASTQQWKDDAINQFYEDLTYLEAIHSEYLPVVLMMEEKIKTISECNEHE